MVILQDGLSAAMGPADGFVRVRLRDIPGITVTYGVVEPKLFTADGVPMLQAQNIVGGRLLPAVEMRIGDAVHWQHRRTWLEEGDLVLVLVGRVGESAVVTAEHAGWNAARSVGVIRCADPWARTKGIIDWLRYWLMAPSMRRWFAREARGFAQPTLSVQSLADLVVPLPSVADRHRCLDMFAQVEERASASFDLARTALETADALFTRLQVAGEATPATLGDVCEARAGGGRSHRRANLDESEVQRDDSTDDKVATADVLNAEFPYRRDRVPGASDPIWTRPGQLLIATKRETAGIVLDVTGDAKTARGTLSVRTRDVRDQWWLLHELRSRPEDLASVAQGASARELSARKFSRLPAAWPTQEVRSEFAEVASALHERAFLALDDHDDMRDLLGLLIERAVLAREAGPAAEGARLAQ